MFQQLGLSMIALALLSGETSIALAHDAHKKHEQMHGETQSQRLSQVRIPSLEGRLVDTVGTPTDLAALLGDRAFILSFSYLDCPEQCPVSDLVMNKLSFDLREDRTAPRLVTLTLDPEHDSHDRLAAHHAEFGSPENWRWAAGEPADVHRLLRRLGVETGTPLAEHDVMFFVGNLGSGRMTPVTGLAAPEMLVEIARQYGAAHHAPTR